MTTHSNSSLRREAFPEDCRRPAKPKEGRTTSRRTPLGLRVHGLVRSEGEKVYVRRRTGFKLGKFALHIRSVMVRFSDESGPKNAPSVICSLRVRLDRLPPIVVRQACPSRLEAFDLALDAAERATRRSLQKLREHRRKAPQTLADGLEPQRQKGGEDV